MTESEFRIKHSLLIEKYQLIEMHLKGICAAFTADEDKGWIERLNDYDNDPLGKLIFKYRELQNEGKTDYLSEADIVKLDGLRENRNYWCHQCFGGENPITFPKGKVKTSEIEEKTVADLKDAEEWDIKLAEVFRKISDKKRLAERVDC